MPRPRLDIADLVRRGRAMAAAATAEAGADEAAASPLRDVTGFGANPGALRMRAFVPDGLPPGAPLLVALHGCTQTAAGFDRGCGWSTLARRLGFALLMPEQAQANNQNRCFNWFEPGDTARGRGEAASIRAMAGHMVAAHGLDPARVTVGGLSAGGAMAAVMLATHPDVFSAGAIVAGLPYGCAASVQEAFEAMATGRPRPAGEWAALVRAAGPAGFRGPWPRVSIWQGTADATVRPVNAGELAKQWAAVHGARPAADEPGGLRRTWRDAAGRTVVEVNTVPGMAHGVPIAPGDGPGRAGAAMPFILDAGISAPHRIAAFLGLGEEAAGGSQKFAASGTLAQPGVIAVGANGQARVAARHDAGTEPTPPFPGRPTGAGAGEVPPRFPAGTAGDPGATIRRALAAAGLLKRP